MLSTAPKPGAGFRVSFGQERFGEGEGWSDWFPWAVERGRRDVGRGDSTWPVGREGVSFDWVEKKRKEEKR